jgi:hypothetical protein
VRFITKRTIRPRVGAMLDKSVTSLVKMIPAVTLSHLFVRHC